MKTFLLLKFYTIEVPTVQNVSSFYIYCREYLVLQFYTGSFALVCHILTTKII